MLIGQPDGEVGAVGTAVVQRGEAIGIHALQPRLHGGGVPRPGGQRVLDIRAAGVDDGLLQRRHRLGLLQMREDLLRPAHGGHGGHRPARLVAHQQAAVGLERRGQRLVLRRGLLRVDILQQIGIIGGERDHAGAFLLHIVQARITLPGRHILQPGNVGALETQLAQQFVIPEDKHIARARGERLRTEQARKRGALDGGIDHQQLPRLHVHPHPHNQLRIVR